VINIQNFNCKTISMLTRRVIYQENQEKFLEDADSNRVATRMLEEAEKV
jgi:hypothetical protein